MIGSSAYMLYTLAISSSVCLRNGEYIFNFTFCQGKFKSTFPAPQWGSLTITLQTTHEFLISGPEVFFQRQFNLAAESLIASDREASCTPGFCVCTNDQTSWLFHRHWTWLLALPKTNQEPQSAWEGIVRGIFPRLQASDGQFTRHGCHLSSRQLNLDVGRMWKPSPCSVFGVCCRQASHCP